jgi:hypothetical protein
VDVVEQYVQSMAIMQGGTRTTFRAPLPTHISSASAGTSLAQTTIRDSPASKMHGTPASNLPPYAPAFGSSSDGDPSGSGGSPMIRTTRSGKRTVPTSTAAAGVAEVSGAIKCVFSYFLLTS